jgi:hypothetical protein
MLPRYRFVGVCLVIGLACLTLVGCSANYMKGTPYFTGEYNKPQGPAEDRVNGWPLYYYHDPALSILWPIGEVVADDHWTVRPLLGVHKLDKAEREIDILWPLIELDYDAGDFRILPLLTFWGDDHGDGRTYAMTLPLYVYRGSEGKSWECDSLWVLPTFYYEPDAITSLFPLFNYTTDNDDWSFDTLWPLFHFSGGGKDGGWRLGPLAGNYWEDDEDGKGGDSYRFLLWPLYSQQEDKDGSGFMNSLGLLWHSSSEADGSWLRFAMWPLYSQQEDKDGVGFMNSLGLLWHSSREADGSWLRFALWPLYSQQEDKDGVGFVNSLGLLWHSSREADGSWLRFALWPLYSQQEDKDGVGFMNSLGLLWHSSSEADGSWMRFALWPLYSQQEDKDGTGFMNSLGLLWHSSREADGSWLRFAMWPLYSQQEDKDGVGFMNILGLLWHSSHKADGSWSRFALGPLCFEWEDKDGKGLGSFPLFVYKENDEKTELFIFPLLSVYEKTPDLEKWFFVPLLTGGEASQDSSEWLCLPLLTGRKETKDATTLGCPLFISKTKRGANREYGVDAKPGKATSYYENYDLCLPPLLFFYNYEHDRLFDVSASGERGGLKSDSVSTYLWPLYHYATESAEEELKQTTEFSLLWFLYNYEHDRLFDVAASGEQGGLKSDSVSTYLWPLYHYATESAEEDMKQTAEFSFLWWLYRRERIIDTRPTADKPLDYTRSRVLGKLYDYEHKNGHTSVDMFPFITYDSKDESDYSKFSFVWRLFRHERNAEGELSLDILFIPFARPE